MNAGQVEQLQQVQREQLQQKEHESQSSPSAFDNELLQWNSCKKGIRISVVALDNKPQTRLPFSFTFGREWRGRVMFPSASLIGLVVVVVMAGRVVTLFNDDDAIMLASFPTAVVNSSTLVRASCFEDSRTYWAAFRNRTRWALQSKTFLFLPLASIIPHDNFLLSV